MNPPTAQAIQEQKLDLEDAHNDGLPTEIRLEICARLLLDRGGCRLTDQKYTEIQRIAIGLMARKILKL